MRASGLFQAFSESPTIQTKVPVAIRSDARYDWQRPISFTTWVAKRREVSGPLVRNRGFWSMRTCS